MVFSLALSLNLVACSTEKVELAPNSQDPSGPSGEGAPAAEAPPTGPFVDDPRPHESPQPKPPDETLLGGGGTEGDSCAEQRDDAGVAGETAAPDGGSNPNDDDSLFLPEGLPNKEVGGTSGGLNLVALTLVKGTNGAELYAAIRNDGDSPSCNAGVVATFFDAAGQQLANAGTGLRSARLYRLNDDSGTITSCVAPGETAMAALTELPEDLVVEDVAYLEYTFPAFDLDVTPIDTVVLADVEALNQGAGSRYTGTLTNVAGSVVRDPAVYVFPLNSVGRPLGVASVSALTELPVGGSWTFQTSTIERGGTSFVAFATVEL